MSSLEVRNRTFALEHVPRHWHARGRAISRFFDNLSIFFPHGERFFMKSVRRFRGAITSEQLNADVNAFCGQEGVHGREHERYNEMLERHGYPAYAMEARVNRLLERVERKVPERIQLGVTCALEHYTATLGRAILEDPRILEGAHPVMAELWRWHAYEENEHKSVAFDVFVAAGGTTYERAVAMIGATIIFWVKVFLHQVRMMKIDGDVYSLTQWLSLFRFLFISPAPLRALIRPVLEYFRATFHPGSFDLAGSSAGALGRGDGA